MIWKNHNYEIKSHNYEINCLFLIYLDTFFVYKRNQ